MSSTGASEIPPAEDLLLSDIMEKYKGRWVAILVTQRDRNSQPVKGQVVADDVDRYGLRERTTKYKDICFFYAGDSPYHLLL